MNFETNEELLALASSLQRMLADRYSFERRRELVASGAPHDETAWARLAELGVIALPLPEAHGGFGGGSRDLLPVMETLGAALSLEPLTATLVAATALRLAAGEEMLDRVLPVVASGDVRLAWAHDEAAGRHAPLWIETRAERRNGRWSLDGSKSVVAGAPLARHFVVSARVSGPPDSREGCALFLVDASAHGVTRRDFRLVDDSCAADLEFSAAEAEPLHDPFDPAAASAAIDGALAAGIAAACAEMAGAAQRAFDLAMEYLRTRTQFGRFIGENQALRHRASEMLVSLEMARSMAIAAAQAADRPEDEESLLDLHRAKLSVARHARAVAHGAIQMHGGIGMTEEYPVGHCLRRIHVLDQSFGDSEAHAARLAAIS